MEFWYILVCGGCDLKYIYIYNKYDWSKCRTMLVIFVIWREEGRGEEGTRATRHRVLYEKNETKKWHNSSVCSRMKRQEWIIWEHGNVAVIECLNTGCKFKLVALVETKWSKVITSWMDEFRYTIFGMNVDLRIYKTNRISSDIQRASIWQI